MRFQIMILALSLVFLSSFTLSAASGQTGNEVKGKVEVIVGKAYLKDMKKWKPLQISDLVTKEDTVRVSGDGSVRIKLSNGNLIEVAGGKTVKLETLMATDTGKKGNMNNLLKKIVKSQNVDTGVTAVAGVRGADISKQKKKVKSDELNWKK